MQSELDMFNRSTILQVPLDPHTVFVVALLFLPEFTMTLVLQRDTIRSSQIPAYSVQATQWLPDTVLPVTKRYGRGGDVLLRATTSVQMFFWLQPTTAEGAEQVRLAAVGARGRKTKLVKQSRSAETKLDINYQEAEQVLFVFPVITKLIKMQRRVKKTEKKKQPPKQIPITNTVFFTLLLHQSADLTFVFRPYRTLTPSL